MVYYLHYPKAATSASLQVNRLQNNRVMTFRSIRYINFLKQILYLAIGPLSRHNLIRINLLFYLFFTIIPSNSCVFLSCRPFDVNATFSTGLEGVEVSSVSWLGQLEFKSLIYCYCRFPNFVCYSALYLGVKITNVGRSLYIGSFCPVMTSLSRFSEEAAFSI